MVHGRWIRALAIVLGLAYGSWNAAAEAGEQPAEAGGQSSHAAVADREGENSKAPWEDSKAFAVDPDEMLRAVAQFPAPEEADVEILLNEAACRFDPRGTREVTRRTVYRILTRAGVEQMAAVTSRWSPWHEQRPELRARVITPDGQAHWLDPKTIGEAPVERAPNIYSDQRLLTAPLPAIRVGAIVETERIVREHRPFFEKGSIERLALVNLYPTRKARVVLQAPADLTLQHAVRGMELKAERSEREGQRRWVYERDAVDALRGIHALLPAEVAPFPYVICTTGGSWQAIAAAYAEMVERKLSGIDLESTARQVVGDEKSRTAVVGKLLRFVQQRVRYTGVAFGEAAILPQAPDGTLARGFGDCKDQSTLLVALLRAAGHEAHVALLQVGNAEDVVADMPGLNAFNHAIVHVPGEPPLWLDPTAAYTPVGQLPIHEQGRRALIIDPATRQLARTPHAPASDNLEEHDTTVRLSETGRSELSITSRYFGASGVRARGQYAGVTPANARKLWQGFLEQQYGGGSLESCEVTPSTDLAEPFETRIKAAGVPFGAVSDAEALVQVFPGSILERLPFVFRMKVDETAVEEAREREHPLVLPERHVTEMRWRIEPPRGYKPVGLPDNWTRRAGCLTLAQRIEADPRRGVTVAFRLDTGDGRLTVAEVEEARKFIVELLEGEGWQLTLRFEHTAQRQLESGRVQEALAEFRRLSEGKPGSASGHSRYALALASAGFGAAARAQARRAVELSPDSALQHLRLGVVLAHDLFGRHFRQGWDRPAALKALKRAVELDPEYGLAHWELSIALEHDEFGNRYAPEGLDEAITHYRRARALQAGGVELDTNLLFALWHAGELKDADQLAGQMVAGDAVAAIRVAIVARRKGADAAAALAGRIAPMNAQRDAVLVNAFNLLQSAREYKRAVAVLEAVEQLDRNPALSRLKSAYSRIKRFEEVAVPASKPEHVIQQLLREVLAARGHREKALSLFTETPNRSGPPARLVQLIAGFRPAVERGLEEGVTVARRGDAVSMMTMESQGRDDLAYRVKIGEGQGPLDRWFVLRRGDDYRVWDTGEQLSALGQLALQRLDEEDLESAKTLLDWAWQEQRGHVALFDSFAGTPFARFWSIARKSEPDDCRLGAALLASTADRPVEAARRLEDARENASELHQLQIDRALVIAYTTLKDAEQGLPIIDRLLEKHARQPELLWRRAELLRDAKRGEELRQWCEQRLESDSDDPFASYVLGRLAGEAGNFAEAEEHLREWAEAPQATLNRNGPAYSALAWNALFRDTLSETALKDAERAVEADAAAAARKPPGGQRAEQLAAQVAALHTLATVQAALGKSEEARSTLLRAIASRWDRRPATQDWYVLGLLAENYGLRDVALDAYRRVEPDQGGKSPSTHTLAQRRLAALADEPAERDPAAGNE